MTKRSIDPDPIADRVLNDKPAPFRCRIEVLGYVNERYPARAKYRSRIEPEARSTVIVEDFTGKSPTDLWTLAYGAIVVVLNGHHTDRAQAWCWRNLGPRGNHWAVEDIAEHFGRHKQRIYEWLNRIDDDLDSELRYRGLIPPEGVE